MLRYILFFTFILFTIQVSIGQQADQETTRNLTFTIDDVIDLAKSQSPEGIQAQHSFRASYWEFRSYKAELLPLLMFNSVLPNFTRAYVDKVDVEGFRYNYSNTVSGNLALNQNIALTGGSLSVSSGLYRTDDFNTKEVFYRSTPLSLVYNQSIFGVNTLKWKKRIEPLRYEEAKRKYLKSVEDVSVNAIRYFFDLAAAQQQVAISEFNKANNDTLYRIAKGRYNIGTIGENDLLQSELNYMNSVATLNDAQLNLATAQNRLRSFLGFNESVLINIIIPDNVPAIEIKLGDIIGLARRNCPELLAYQRQLIEADQNVAREKANRGFVANLQFSYGLNQFGETLSDVYRNPKEKQTIELALQIPILDWGRGKGRVKMAQSNQELVRAKVAQDETDFDQSVILLVNQFLTQGDQFKITAKADTIAQNRYKVSMQRYLIDKITITDMNNAQNDKDAARLRYVTALRNYWSYYYSLRRVTLYDLLNNRPISVVYDDMVR